MNNPTEQGTEHVGILLRDARAQQLRQLNNVKQNSARSAKQWQLYNDAEAFGVAFIAEVDRLLSR